MNVAAAAGLAILEGCGLWGWERDRLHLRAGGGTRAKRVKPASIILAKDLHERSNPFLFLAAPGAGIMPPPERRIADDVIPWSIRMVAASDIGKIQSTMIFFDKHRDFIAAHGALALGPLQLVGADAAV